MRLRLYEVFEAITIICVDHTDIDDICPFPTFLKLASVLLAPRSFVVFLVFRPFPEWLVCFGKDDHTEWGR